MKLMKLRTRYLLVLVALLACSKEQPETQTRGAEPVNMPIRTAENLPLYAGSYALLIGVSDYTNGWADLESIPGELSEIRETLVRCGFDVTLVLNPDGNGLKNAFENFINTHGYGRENRLLFFFSGHGHSRGTDKGYLVPADAPMPDENNPADFLQKALDMTQILSWSKQMEAKHVLYLFDSCFSGTIFKTRALPVTPPLITAATAKPVRQFITSGSADETVPAKSVFAAAFDRGIRNGSADLNGDGYITGVELGLFLREKVLDYQNGQTPQYGKIRDPELDEGDFVILNPAVGNAASLDTLMAKNSRLPVMTNIGIPQTTPAVTIQPVATKKFRTAPVSELSNGNIKQMVLNNDFFERQLNPNGKGFLNDFAEPADGKVILDLNSGLMWQKDYAQKPVTVREAEEFARRLNHEKFASYSDWRIPTLEEAFTLVERAKQSNGLLIDSQFEGKFRRMLTADMFRRMPWLIDFGMGVCVSGDLNRREAVRFVRTEMPSGGVRFRSVPLTDLTEDGALKLRMENGMYDTAKNKTGNGFFKNDLLRIKSGQVVADKNSGLMWQQSGSSGRGMHFSEAQAYIEQLNRESFAGYNDWRLPTLDEAMTILETQKMNGELYIDPLFDQTNYLIWTADQLAGTGAWTVHYRDCFINIRGLENNIWVRAVRSTDAGSVN